MDGEMRLQVSSRAVLTISSDNTRLKQMTRAHHSDALMENKKPMEMVMHIRISCILKLVVFRKQCLIPLRAYPIAAMNFI
jgi:hypothetical protein